MNNFKRALKRGTALAVAAMMCVGMLQISVFAENTELGEPPVSNPKDEIAAELTDLNDRLEDDKETITPTTPEEGKPTVDDLKGAVEDLVGNGEKGENKVDGVVSDAKDAADDAKDEADKALTETQTNVGNANTNAAASDTKVEEAVGKDGESGKAGEAETIIDDITGEGGLQKETEDKLAGIVSDAEAEINDQAAAMEQAKEDMAAAVEAATAAQATAEANKAIAESEDATVEEKEQAAADAQAAADEAQAAAESAETALEAANAAKDAAAEVAAAAEAEYKAAVEEANAAIGEKKAEAEQKLKDAADALTEAARQKAAAEAAANAANAAKDQAAAFATQAAEAARIAREAYDVAASANTKLEGEKDKLDTEVINLDKQVTDLGKDIQEKQDVIDALQANKENANNHNDKDRKKASNEVNKAVNALATVHVNVNCFPGKDFPAGWNDPLKFSWEDKAEWYLENYEKLDFNAATGNGDKQKEHLEKAMENLKDARNALDAITWTPEKEAALTTATTEKGNLETALGTASANLASSKAQQEALEQYLGELAFKLSAAETLKNQAALANQQAQAAAMTAESAAAGYREAQAKLDEAQTRVEQLQAQLDAIEDYDAEAKLAEDLEAAKLALEKAEQDAEQAAKDKEDAEKAADEAQKAADDAQQAADEARRELENQPQPPVVVPGGDDEPGTDDPGYIYDDADDGDDDTGYEDPTVSIDEEDVPLSGLTTRAELVAYLYELEGSPAAELSSFTDVAADSEYAMAIGWAAANGIVAGYPDGSFGPDNLVTVAELRWILTSYASYKGIEFNLTLEGEAGDVVPDCGAILNELLNGKED